jgi:hypothetical protein
MMKPEHSKWIVPTALAFAVTSAWAGEIRLYERPDFRGPALVTSSRVDTVARQGLGDTASSVVVADGRWEVCTMEYFRGRCTELLPGSYPSMGVSLNGRIASVREIGYSEPLPVTIAPSPPVVVVDPPTYSRSTVVPVTVARAYLYEDPNFSGARVTIDRGEANDLDWAHFQNPMHRATSVRVESGNWLFCTDMAFQGNCRIFGPGDYATLGGDMIPGIASARPVATPQYGAVSVYRRY